MTDLTHQTTKELFRLIPPAVAPDFFQDYGLTLNPHQAQAVTKELLALTTYWMTCAIRVSIPEPLSGRIRRTIHEEIREHWTRKFGMGHVPIDQFFEAMEKKHQRWDRLAQHGGEPIAVLSHAARDLEADNAISAQDEHKILAVLLDLVPIDEIGALIAELEQHVR